MSLVRQYDATASSLGNFHNILARNILARNVLEMKILAMNILSRKQKLKSGDTTRCHGNQPGQ